MNRMKLGPLAAKTVMTSSWQPASGKAKNQQAGESVLDLNFTKDLFSAATPTQSNCFLPIHYESRHAYPLLMWLHSAGGSPTELNEVMPWISERNYLGVSVSGSEALGPEQFDWRQSAEAIERTANHVLYAIDIMSGRFHIDRHRVFIAGSGSGATMAFRIAFEMPHRFAGIASLNGSLPCNLQPLSNWRLCRKLPVFWTHGRKSSEFPERNLCHQLKLMHVAGFDVTLRQYPSGDELSDQACRDLNSWIMEQLADQGGNIVS